MHQIFIARQDGGRVQKFIILTLEEIGTIISEATPTNTNGATACGVFVYSFVFLLIKFNDFSTVIEMHLF